MSKINLSVKAEELHHAHIYWRRDWRSAPALPEPCINSSKALGRAAGGKRFPFISDIDQEPLETPPPGSEFRRNTDLSGHPGLYLSAEPPYAGEAFLIVAPHNLAIHDDEVV